jgi:MFS family permease
LNRAFASLRYPNYRLWFFGQMISLVGTWMQTTAQAYLAFELTKSPAFLGWLAFANGVPAWFFMLFAGAAVDRGSKRMILLLSQTVMMVLALLLAGLTYLNWLQPWHLLLFSLLLGIANSFDVPARQSIANDLVDRKDLTNALALNAALFNTGSTLGPALAGIIYVVYGPVWCFLINGLSFIAVIYAILRLRLTKKSDGQVRGSLWEQLREGIGYVKAHAIIRSLVLMSAATSLFGISVVTIFPAWATEYLQGDARVAGYLQAGRGVGAVFGAIAVAYFSATLARGRVITFGATLLPLALVGFSVAGGLPWSMIFVAIIGTCQIMIMNLSNSILHAEVKDQLRGRVSSIFSLTFFGLLPLGSLLIGYLSEVFSEHLAIRISAVAFLLLAFATIYSRVGGRLKDHK